MLKATRKPYTCQMTRTKHSLKKEEQQQILQQQNNRCIYCNYQFGSVFRDKKKHRHIVLGVAWDHFTPWSYIRSHNVTFVAACQICNSIKGAYVFDTLADACAFISKGRGQQWQYEPPDP